MKTRRDISVVLVFVLIMGMASSATAIIIPRFEFEAIGSVMVDIEDIDLFGLVMEGGPGQVIIEFHNQSKVQSSISSICFEDSGLDRVNDIQSPDNIFFDEDIKPANFPGGVELEPDFDTSLSIGAVPSPVWHGINPGEQLVVTVALDYGTSYSDILSSFNNGSLRIGMHVIALPDGSSFSVVNEIPEPATIALLGFGSMILIGRSKFKKDWN